MAEYEDDPLYPMDVDAVLDGDRLEVIGQMFGPAGVSVIELPDGGTWQVDHADPGELVTLDVEADVGHDAPLMVTAFGGDGAMFVADRAVPADEYEPRAVSGRRFTPRRVTSRRLPGGPAEAAGALVVLADLADDDALHPLARIAAVVELAQGLRGTPAGRLVASALPALLDRAEVWSEQVDDAELTVLDRKQGVRLSSAIRAATSPDRRVRPALRRLAQRLTETVYLDDHEFVMHQVVHAQIAMPVMAVVDDPDEPPRSGTTFEWLSDTIGLVTTTRSGDERWVRILRRDGLVLLALAPLERSGLVDRAEVALPPDITDDEFEIQFVDDDEFPVAHPDRIEHVRAAVQAGRTAARSTRLDDRQAAEHQWERCAELWDRVGDRFRAEQARELAYGYRANRPGRPFLADELARSLDAG